MLQSWAHALGDGFIREGSPVQKLMNEQGISFVAFSPLAQGQLLGKYDPKNPPTFEEGDHRRNSEKFQAANLEKLAPKIEKLKSRFGGEIRDLARVALQYVLHTPEVCCVIPGFRNQRQVETNLWADGKPLTDADVAYVREVLAD